MSDTMLEAVIPFDGFYDSDHSDFLDRQTKQWLADSDGMDRTSKSFMKSWEHIDFKAVYKDYSELYAEMFSDLIEVRLEFERLVPRVCSRVDQIFVKIALKDAKKMFAETDKDALNKLIKRKIPSSGLFIAYYANDLSEWPADLAEWDDVQIGVLLEAYALQIEIDKYFKDYENESLVFFSEESEACYKIIDATCDIIYKHANDHFKRLKKISDYLNLRGERSPHN